MHVKSRERMCEKTMEKVRESGSEMEIARKIFYARKLCGFSPPRLFARNVVFRMYVMVVEAVV